VFSTSILSRRKDELTLIAVGAAICVGVFGLLALFFTR
jgi:hypothetical protein